MALLILLVFATSAVHGQHRRPRFPIWTFHQKNVNIYGVSVGIISGLWSGNTYTNGIKLELIGLGLAVPMIPQSPIAENDTVFRELQKDTISEQINGISLAASGTVCECAINGASFGYIGQIVRKVNGVSATIFMNFSQVHNGIQLAFVNQAYRMSGLQIGLFNGSRDTWGIQIGLWNVNERRKMPVINWNFKRSNIPE
jgi:hypothetical protein